jgi:hypothetical protein
MEKLVFPQEIEVWYVLPAIRSEFAKALVEQGLAQKDIASILGVTEAAISQYKKDKRAKDVEFNLFVKRMVKDAAKRVSAQPQRIFGEIMAINDYLKKSGVFCQIHRQKSATPDGCEHACKMHFFPEMKSEEKR